MPRPGPRDDPDRRLPASFFARDALELAPDLVGRDLRLGPVRIRITETEAYRWSGDSACHARSGPTARNRPMFGPPGRLYVYLCYGLHHLLNVVADAEGRGAAVLVRAAEPVEGLDIIEARRGRQRGPALLAGPGRVGAALALDTSWCHHPLHEPGGLELLAGRPPARLRRGPRVGIGYAEPDHQLAPWRFAADGTSWITRPRELGDPLSRHRLLAQVAREVRAPRPG